MLDLKREEKEMIRLKIHQGNVSEIIRNALPNRIIGESRSGKLNREMKSGSFVNATSMMKFNKEGRCGDGIGRAVSVRETGVAIEVWALLGCTDEDFMVTDTGKSRTTCDFFQIKQIKYPAPLATAVRHLIALEKHQDSIKYDGKIQTSWFDESSHKQRLEYYEANKEVLDKIATLTCNKKITHSALIICYKMIWNEDPSERDGFMIAITEGHLVHKNNTIKAARDILLDRTIKHFPLISRIHCLFYAWNHRYLMTRKIKLFPAVGFEFPELSK